MFAKIVQLLLALILLQCAVNCAGVRSAPKCPDRSESDARCRKECRTNADCRNRKNNKRCICDGPCGLSCIRINQKCYEDRSLVTRLRKGTVLLNGRRYSKKIFRVGDTVSYTCKRGFKLSGPSQVTCSGIGKWKPWDKGTPVCSKRCKDPGNPKDGYRLEVSFDVGETVRFICNPGYTLKGSPQALCMSSLEWSRPRPVCEASKCQAPILPSNSNIIKGKRSSYPYGSRVILRCNPGHYLRGSSLMYCGSGGWKAPLDRTLRCLPKSCGSPSSVSNGFIKGTLYTFGKFVTYSCNTGYRLRGLHRRRCLANENWSGSSPLCEKVDCGRPEAVTNGKIIQYGTKYLDQASVTCDVGYTTNGSKTISCTSSGKWNGKLECIGITCDERYNSIDNGIAIGRHVKSSCRNSYNCKLTFSCSYGFQLNSGKGTKVVVCKGDGTWSGLKPVCQRISCAFPPIPSHGRLKESRGNFLFESVIEYVCNRGYDIIGTSTRQCLGNGEWSGSVPRCEANCGDPGVLHNGHIYGSSFRSGDRLTFSCSHGYEIIGRSSSICDQSTARWVPEKPKCNRISCGPPLVPLHGRLKESRGNFLFESVIEYVCNRGYDIIGTSTRQCLGNGEWSGSVPRCEANCGDPGVLHNGHIYGSSFRSGDRLTFSCSHGYEIIGRSSSICDQSTARWVPEKPKCNLISCDAPSIPTYGRVRDATSHYAYKSIITYECNKGYDMIGGTSTMECLLSKQWNGTVPVCRANCGDPGTPAHGYRVGNGFTAGETITFKCDSGYTLFGADRTICEDHTAKWTREIPTCSRKCDYDLGMKNGRITDEQISMSHSVRGFDWKPRFQSKNKWCGQYQNGEIAVRIQFKSVVTIESVYFQEHDEITGWFHYYDAKKRKETFSGKNYGTRKLKKISPPIQTSFFEIVMRGTSSNQVCEKFEIYGCVASTTCPIPKAPKNGETLGLLYNDGDKALYSCYHGYKLDSKVAQTCMADGSWSGDIPECIRDHSQGVCYKDFQKQRTLRLLSLNTSPDECVEICKGRGYRYAGLQYGYQCFCGHSIKQELVARKSECYMPCGRDPTRKCGGPWRNSIYKIW